MRGIHPWDEPMTLRESGGGRVPSFKTGRVGLEGKDARIRGALEVRAFREAHAPANEAWCAGDRAVSYPHGTYEMRRFHGARVAAPAPDAWVSAPGPTLDEVKADLEEDGVTLDEGLVDRVREAVVQGVEEMVADAKTEPASAEPAEDEGEETERGEAERHHRFTKLRPREPGRGPRRIIRLRDKRRGRGTGPPEE